MTHHLGFAHVHSKKRGANFKNISLSFFGLVAIDHFLQDERARDNMPVCGFAGAKMFLAVLSIFVVFDWNRFGIYISNAGETTIRHKVFDYLIVVTPGPLFERIF